MMKKTVFTSIVLCLCIILLESLIFLPYQVDFSGTWLLDTLKSDFGGAPRAYVAPEYIKINHLGNEMTFERKFSGKDKITEKLVQGADSLEMQLGIPGYKKWSTLEISKNKDSIIVDSYGKVEQDGNGFTFKRKEVYTLSKDEKVLIWKQETDRNNSITVLKCLYNRNF